LEAAKHATTGRQIHAGHSACAPTSAGACSLARSLASRSLASRPADDRPLWAGA